MGRTRSEEYLADVLAGGRHDDKVDVFPARVPDDDLVWAAATVDLGADCFGLFEMRGNESLQFLVYLVFRLIHRILRKVVGNQRHAEVRNDGNDIEIIPLSSQAL